MNSAFSLIDIVVFLCGIYILYLAYNLKRKGEIKDGLLLPKDVSIKKCLNKTAYIDYIFPRTVIYGVAVTICGAICLIDDKYQILHNWYYAVMVVFLAFTVWFGYETKKSYKNYWPMQKKK